MSGRSVGVLTECDPGSLPAHVGRGGVCAGESLMLAPVPGSRPRRDVSAGIRGLLSDGVDLAAVRELSVPRIRAIRRRQCHGGSALSVL